MSANDGKAHPKTKAWRERLERDEVREVVAKACVDSAAISPTVYVVDPVLTPVPHERAIEIITDAVMELIKRRFTPEEVGKIGAGMYLEGKKVGEGSVTHRDHRYVCLHCGDSLCPIGKCPSRGF